MSGIIVRDDATRESFKTEIGRVGVTLYVRSFLCCFRCSVAIRTLFNSKGLEYDDVSLTAETHTICTHTSVCVCVCEGHIVQLLSGVRIRKALEIYDK